MVALAMRTGIPVSVWLAEEDRVLDTALDLLAEDERRASAVAGPQMSG